LEKRNSLLPYFDHADVFMVALSSNEIVIDINRKAIEILGFAKEEIVGKNWFETFVPKDKKEEAKKIFHNMLSGTLRHVHSEHQVVTKQGEERTINFHNILVSDEKGGTIGVLSSGDDVTERKRKEKELKKIENRLQISLDSMIEGCQIIDYDWRYAYINEAAAKQGRKKKEELLDVTMMQAYPGIDRTEMFNHLRNCMVNRVPYQMNNEFTYPDKSKAWFKLSMEPVPEGVLILSIDITQSKAIEEELNNYRYRLEQVVAQRTAECAKVNQELTSKIQEAQKIEESLKLRTMILDNAKEAIFLTNIKGDFLYSNESATKAYGYSLDEFLNKNIRALLQPKDTTSLEMLLKHIIEKGQTSLEMVHMKKNGTLIPVKVDSNVLKTTHGQIIVMVIRKLYYR